jgi:hypothetical protein
MEKSWNIEGYMLFLVYLFDRFWRMLYIPVWLVIGWHFIVFALFLDGSQWWTTAGKASSKGSQQWREGYCICEATIPNGNSLHFWLLPWSSGANLVLHTFFSRSIYHIYHSHFCYSHLTGEGQRYIYCWIRVRSWRYSFSKSNEELFAP